MTCDSHYQDWPQVGVGLVELVIMVEWYVRVVYHKQWLAVEIVVSWNLHTCAHAPWNTCTGTRNCILMVHNPTFRMCNYCATEVGLSSFAGHSGAVDFVVKCLCGAMQMPAVDAADAWRLQLMAGGPMLQQLPCFHPALWTQVHQMKVVLPQTGVGTSAGRARGVLFPP